jgi:hypothetical protein
MANEIRISAISGLSITVQVYSGATLVGSPVAATEIGTTGEYLASMPAAALGTYLLVAYAGTEKIASSLMYWDGSKEVGTDPEVALMTEEFLTIEGYKAGVVAENSPTMRKAGSVELAIAGYGSNFTTVQKV